MPLATMRAAIEESWSRPGRQMSDVWTSCNQLARRENYLMRARGISAPNVMASRLRCSFFSPNFELPSWRCRPYTGRAFTRDYTIVRCVDVLAHNSRSVTIIKVQTCIRLIAVLKTFFVTRIDKKLIRNVPNFKITSMF